MKPLNVADPAFKPYGRVLPDISTAVLRKVLRSETDKPVDGVTYVPSLNLLENLPIFSDLQDSVFGGMPIQIGYCNGTNTNLTCLEYHRSSEINIVDNDIILLLARQQDIENGTLSTDSVKAFRVPAGTAVELYATTLHYAPCDGHSGRGFRVAVILPRGTNTEKPTADTIECDENHLLWARNKWLLAHADSPEAGQGAAVRLVGDKISVASYI